MKTVIVEIDPNGKIKIEASGFSGNACEKATAALEAAMGKPGPREKKKDWHVVTNQSVGGR